MVKSIVIELLQHVACDDELTPNQPLKAKRPTDGVETPLSWRSIRDAPRRNLRKAGGINNVLAEVVCRKR